LALGAIADVAFWNNGFGACGAFPAFRRDLAGNAESCVSPWPRRRRGLSRRLMMTDLLANNFGP
jgi:hypothetical protein